MKNSLIPLKLTSYILDGKMFKTKIITVKQDLTDWILFIFPPVFPNIFFAVLVCKPGYHSAVTDHVPLVPSHL